MPVQWAFKFRLQNGRPGELILRRVKQGNETACEPLLMSDAALHLKGRFSDAQTLVQRLNDASMPAELSWAAPAVHTFMNQMAGCLRQLPSLVHLFVPKGKIECYGPQAPFFDAQYISGNHTMKWHAESVQTDEMLFTRLAAQHLDYPFAPGERRFSTSRLFDLCFTAEKVIMPNSLAAHIDAHLHTRGIYQPERHEMSDYDHVQHLLGGGSAALRNSYERVLQRERFAAMVAHHYGRRQQPHPAPLLTHYSQLVLADLMTHQGNDYKDYPPKKMDSVAEAVHVPLMMIFTAGKHGRTGATD